MIEESDLIPVFSNQVTPQKKHKILMLSDHPLH
jgi:hypothetical protein